MANSHFKVLINRDADFFRMLLVPFFVKSFPGVQLQKPGKASDHINLVVDAYHSSDARNVAKYKGVPHLKIILITGEPHGIDHSKAGFVHLIIDCKRDPSLRPNGVPWVYLPFYVDSFAERLHHPHHVLLPDGFGKNDAIKIMNNKPKFCAFMYSQPVAFRDALFDAFARNYKSPDALGACRSNKQRSDTDRIEYHLLTRTYYESAVEKYKPYKFVIACENSRIAGYVTEKIVNPKLAHAVPIYLGAPDLFDDGVFNRKAIIHVADFKSYEDCVAYVKKVDESPELYLQYVQEPLFVGNKLPEYFRSDYLLPHVLRVFGQ
jgi:hypothetical protein